MGDAIPFDEMVEQVAQVCHTANRAWCVAHGDLTQQPWEDAPEWQKRSSIDGVRMLIANPSAGADACHRSWAEQKISEGWRYGEEKDPIAKTHPCLVAFSDLPREQRLKDHLFLAIVRALSG